MNGVICIDKPSGMTSFDVVAVMRRLAHEKKAGHCGTLDPMATGVLPVFFGEATKAIPLLQNHDKHYRAGFKLGMTTDTGDITGKILKVSQVCASREEVENAALSFIGTIKQVPPMFSAIKVNGKRLYDIARAGGTVERKARDITVYNIKMVDKDDANYNYIMNVECSGGTYIRTLCEDIGRKLGCGAVMSSLRRTYASGFSIDNCISIEYAKKLAEQEKLNDIVLSVEELFNDLPDINVTRKQAVRFRNGGELSSDRLDNAPESGLCRVSCGLVCIGLGEAVKGQVKVKCHFNRNITI